MNYATVPFVIYSLHSVRSLYQGMVPSEIKIQFSLYINKIKILYEKFIFQMVIDYIKLTDTDLNFYYKILISLQSTLVIYS